MAGEFEDIRMRLESISEELADLAIGIAEARAPARMILGDAETGAASGAVKAYQPAAGPGESETARD